MKNLQLLPAEPWPRLCVGELGALKKLRRKHKEAARPHVGGCKSFQVALKVSGRLARAAGRAGAAPERRAGLAPAPPRPEPDLPPAAVHGRQGAQPFPEQSLPPRLVLGPPLESAYPPGAQVAYGSAPESAASPRKRAGEAAGGASEIKAIQQTRRLLANARERTRVHTISAAFEALRKQVPCYSYGQKLSKLAILRIACNYILSLARLADMDYSADHSNMSFSDCVEQCTRTLQAEGRSKKRKE
ncbi:transcription factor ATOH8 isoform X1 [Carettochelys insculpta]|uniref:transcription factor ATOH8 isoform X1 n=1 Tax=Carettochelys insculpta TaxID=44489 RepID=UPI003EBAA049